MQIRNAYSRVPLPESLSDDDCLFVFPTGSGSSITTSANDIKLFVITNNTITSRNVVLNGSLNVVNKYF